MIHRRFFIFIAAALILIAVLAGGLWYLLRGGGRVSEEGAIGGRQSAVVREAERLRQIAREGRAQGGLERTAPQIAARVFLERYGSYSNQSDFENLEDLYPFMTARLREAEAARVSRMRASLPADAQYEGVSTKVVGIALLSASETSAVARAQTQRREQSVRGERIFYQSAEITLTREGELWKVDEVQWQ